MSEHVSLVMIQGDHRARLPDLFEVFDYRLTGTVEKLNIWEQVYDAIKYPRPGKSKDLVHKAVFFHDGWTVILDPEYLMIADEDACEKVSQMLDSSLFAMACEGASNSYGYSFYDHRKLRSFWSDDGVIQDDWGEKLTIEEGIDLSTIFEDDVFQIIRELGVNYLTFDEVTEFLVFEFDESHNEAPPETLPVPETVPPKKKSWWKLW
jgi:hypothetical protein